jgi:hypothetical protein
LAASDLGKLNAASAPGTPDRSSGVDAAIWLPKSLCSPMSGSNVWSAGMLVRSYHFWRLRGFDSRHRFHI